MPTHNSSLNQDTQEIEKFNSLAHEWWDLQGNCKPLHQINPLRLEFIEKHCSLTQMNVLDVGCGGGILTEALAKADANVTGIDLAQDSINVAKSHALNENLNIHYQCIDINDFALTHTGQYDVLTCMELLEHVPRPKEMVAACVRCVKPGGSLFFSTINRNLKAYLQAILGAEYLLRLLPIGTHQYEKFIQPSELAAWCREFGLSWENITGLTYNPISKHYHLTKSLDVNYLAHCRKIG